MAQLAIYSPAYAAVRTWLGGNSSTWAQANNWSGSQIPGPADSVVINGSYTFAPILDLTAGGITISSLNIGQSATSLLTVQNGNVTTNILTISGDLTIGGFGTITHTAHTPATTHRLGISVGGNASILAGGAIDLTALGFQGGQTDGAAGSGTSPGGGNGTEAGGGASHGGLGTAGYLGGTAGAAVYGSVNVPVSLGSGGGAGDSTAIGGNGGGALSFNVTETLNISGSIRADGGNGLYDGTGDGGGGGSGGSIYILASVITGAGNISANGGNGDTTGTSDGGAGGGGRIALHYTTNSFSGTLTTYGGIGNTKGGAGTIFYKGPSDTNGHLIIQNNAAGSYAMLTEGFTFDSVTLGTFGNLRLTKGLSINMGSSISATNSSILHIPSEAVYIGPTLDTLTNLTIINEGVFPYGGSTLTIPATVTWKENSTLGLSGDTSGVTDIVINGTLEFQNQDSITPATFNSITVNNGGVLTHIANPTVFNDMININAVNFSIATGGAIDVDGKGFAGSGSGSGNGTGASLSGSPSSSGGAGHGGNGGAGGGSSGSAGGASYGSIVAPLTIGSGAGRGDLSTGGNGGGAVRIFVQNSLLLDGQISSDGTAGSIGTDGAGGGSGGSVYINAASITGSGSITADGGNGFSVGWIGGGGGGGHIAMHYTTNSLAGTVTAYGGSGYRYGGAGTIFSKASSDTNGHLTIDNNNHGGVYTPIKENLTLDTLTLGLQAYIEIASGYTLTLISPTIANAGGNYLHIASGGVLTGPATANLSDITIINDGLYSTPVSTLTIPAGVTWSENGTLGLIGDTSGITDIVVNGTLEFQNQNITAQATFNSITVNNGGILTHQANTTTFTDMLNLAVSNMTVNSGGTIDIKAKGYLGSSAGIGNGPGATLSSTNGSGGAAHGGDGGAGYAGSAGGTGYGSTKQPLTIGSGAGNGSGSTGGSGGGALRLDVSSNLTLDGTITADGGDGTTGTDGAGGGAGGSIYITMNTFSGNGTVSANGGVGHTAGYDGGGGGGGRIALYYNINTYAGSISALGGNGYLYGGAGTIFTKPTADPNGHLTVNNENHGGRYTTINDSFTLDTLTIQNQAYLKLTTGYTLAVLAGSISTDVGTVLNISSGAVFDGPDPSALTNLTVKNSGLFITDNSTFTVPSGVTWEESGLLGLPGDTSTVTDIVVNGTLEFQNQNSTTQATFNSMTINNGGILTHLANNTTFTNMLNLAVANITINTGGQINLEGKGYSGVTAGNGYGPGGSVGNNSWGSGGAGHGGIGGTAQPNGSVGGTSYGSIINPQTIGSGAGHGHTGLGGAGGGALKLVVGSNFVLDGITKVNGSAGSAGSHGAGGGSGGSIHITAATITGNGSINADGGAASLFGNDGGGGGGGHIAIYHTNNSFTGNLSAYGGSGYMFGGAGTIFLRAPGDANGHLIVDNNNHGGVYTPISESLTLDTLTLGLQAYLQIASGSTVTLISPTINNAGGNYLHIASGGAFNGPAHADLSNISIIKDGQYSPYISTLTIPAGVTWKDNGMLGLAGDTSGVTDIVINGTLELQNTSPTTYASFNSITVNNGGTLTHKANDTTLVDALYLRVNDLTVNTGGSINVNGLGYVGAKSTATTGWGPGGGLMGSGTTAGGGAGYGGAGGKGYGALGGLGGAVYGSSMRPWDGGSGGSRATGGSGAIPGSGGGMIRVYVTNNLLLDGAISANGANGGLSGSYGAGAGSGGGIFISANAWNGSGSITAIGGTAPAAPYKGGGGGGGRIAIYYGSKTYSGTYQVTGGTGSIAGDVGTYHDQLNIAPNVPSSLGGTSYVDGSKSNDSTPTLSFSLTDPNVVDELVYDIEIDDSADFGSPVVHYRSDYLAQGVHSFTVGQTAGTGVYLVGAASQTLPYGGYYWRIKVKDATDAHSSYATANSGAVAFIVTEYYSISGTITKNAAALAGVTITATGIGSTTTNASGVYTFAGVERLTDYTITPSLAGHTFSPVSTTGTLNGNATHNFTATLNTHSISGVVTAGGNPLSGVSVDAGAIGTTTTDGSGAYSFTGVDYGTAYTITPTKAGYTFSPVQASATLTANATHNFTATLNTHSISGVITAGGNPLSGVSVDAGAIGTTTTDGSGAYSFTGVDYGTSYTVTPTKAGYTLSPVSASATLTANATHNFTATLNTHSISGVITAGGNPLSGVSVDAGAIGTTTTDGSGTYSFTGVDYGTSYTVTPTKAGYTLSPVSASATLTANATHNFTATLNTHSISGTITAGGNPLPGVSVDAGAIGTTTTDGSGAYSFSGVDYGTAYTITPTKAGYTLSAVSASATLTANATHNFTATLNTHSISGVITAGGNPLSGVSINAGAIGTTTTDESGAYSFSGVDYGTSYTVTPTKSGYTFSPVSASATLTANATHNFTATLNTHSISGVITAGGNPLSGVSIDAGAIGTTTTDESGAYSFTGVDYGTAYTVTPTKSGYTFSPVSASATLTANATHNFTATLNTHSISGFITAGGNPLSGVSVDAGAIGTTTTDGSGAYSFTGVDYGTTYTVTPTKAGYTFSPVSASATLTANATHNFTATLNTHSISGVITAGGNPLSGVSVDAGAIGTTTTDESGAYSFTGVDYGTAYTLTPSKPGFTFSAPLAIGTLGANTIVNFTAHTISYVIAGTVTVDGIPLAGVQVEITDTETVETDEAGQYSFVALPQATPYTVTPHKLGYTFSPESASGTLNESLTIDFVGTRETHNIAGTVTVDGLPLQGVLIDGGDLGDRYTDETGAYSFTDVAYGTTYTLVPSKANYSFVPANATGVVTQTVEENFVGQPVTDDTGDDNGDDNGDDTVDDNGNNTDNDTDDDTGSNTDDDTDNEPRLTSLTGLVKLGNNGLSDIAINGGILGNTQTKADGTFVLGSASTGSSYTITPSSRYYAFSPATLTVIAGESDGLIFSATAIDSDLDTLSDISEIEQYKTNPKLKDTDADGVDDGDEIAAETNPLDYGSLIEAETFKYCGLWGESLGVNGSFTEPRAVSEIVNRTGEAVRLRLSLLEISGRLRYQGVISLLPNNSKELLLGSIGKKPLAYGQYCLGSAKNVVGQFSGSVLHYLVDGSTNNSAPPESTIRGVYNKEFIRTRVGKQYLVNSSYLPKHLRRSASGSRSSGLLYKSTTRYELSNYERRIQKGTLLFYDQSGKLISKRQVTIAGNGIKEVQGIAFGENKLGLVEWSPNDKKARIGFSGNRDYTVDISAAPLSNNQPRKHFITLAQIIGTRGTGDELSGFIDTTTGENFVELGNTSNKEIKVQLDVFTDKGKRRARVALAIPARAARSINLSTKYGKILGHIAAKSNRVGSLVGSIVSYRQAITDIVDSDASTLSTADASKPLALNTFHTTQLPLTRRNNAKLQSTYNNVLAGGVKLVLVNSGNNTSTVQVITVTGNSARESLITMKPREVKMQQLCKASNQICQGVVSAEPKSPKTANFKAYVIRYGKGGNNVYGSMR